MYKLQISLGYGYYSTVHNYTTRLQFTVQIVLLTQIITVMSAYVCIYVLQASLAIGYMTIQTLGFVNMILHVIIKLIIDSLY